VLLSVIAAAVQGREFSAVEVMKHARVTPVLAQTLTAARLTNARALGQYLLRVEGRPVGHVRVQRIGEDRDGIIWRCEFCP
jgi:hypothetical protein